MHWSPIIIGLAVLCECLLILGIKKGLFNKLVMWMHYREVDVTGYSNTQYCHYRSEDLTVEAIIYTSIEPTIMPIILVVFLNRPRLDLQIVRNALAETNVIQYNPQTNQIHNVLSIPAPNGSLLIARKGRHCPKSVLRVVTDCMAKLLHE